MKYIAFSTVSAYSCLSVYLFFFLKGILLDS